MTEKMSARRSRVDLRRWGRVALLALVVLAPAAASWHGLTALGRDTFGLGWASFLVPLVLDAAALYLAWEAMEDVVRGDSATVNRALIWFYAMGSAALNAYHSDRASQDVSAALFFAAASVSAVVLWDRTLRRIRREELRAGGHLENPLPRYRALRWVFAPVATFGMFRDAVVYGLSTAADAKLFTAAKKRHPVLAEVLEPAELVAFSRVEAGRPGLSYGEWVAELADSEDQVDDVDQAATPSPRATVSLVKRQPVHEVDRLPAPALAPELAGMSKAQAIIRGLRALGADPDTKAAKRKVPAAVAWCAERGLVVDRSYGYHAHARHLQGLAARRQNVVQLPAPELAG